MGPERERRLLNISTSVANALPDRNVRDTSELCFAVDEKKEEG